MENFNLPNEVMISLGRMNIISPTEIQKQTIPLAMEGRDILASSQTGSGKTFAYLLPIISSIIKTNGRALVLTPTRELATQVRDALNQVSGSLRISNAVLIGGEPMPKQFSQLKGTPKVIVGTPGRIIDHLNRGTLKLSTVNMVVLDEMDRMLDMGMKEQLEEIVKFIPAQRQVLMFSATMPKHIVALSQKYLNNPHHVTVGSNTQPASDIKQESTRLSVKEKLPELLRQLEEREGSVIIFVKTKRGADELAKNLKVKGHKAEAIHGDLRQSRRDRVLFSFRKSFIRILVATDVAARGLDIPHTQHVINYDLPMSPEDYLHRIGRTGRAGAKGYALSFITPDENGKWRAIERLISHGETTSREEMMGPRSSKPKSFKPRSFGGRGPEGDKKPFRRGPSGPGGAKRSFGSDRNGSDRNNSGRSNDKTKKFGDNRRRERA